MKKLNSFLTLGLAALMGAFVFTSCSEEETKPAPSITFNVGGSDVTTTPAVAGTALSYKLTVSAPGGIKSITVFEGTDESNKVQKSNKTEGFISDTLDIITSSVTPSATITKVFVEVTDKKDQVSKSSLTLTLGGNAINTYTATLVSAYNASSSTQYFDALTGTASNVSSAGSATFGFVSGGANNGASIFTNGGFTSTQLSQQPSPWNVSAKIAKTNLSAAEFTAISDETALLAAISTDPTGVLVNHLQAGGTNADTKVIAFISGTKKGLILVPATINNDAAQSIAISVKVQK